MECHKCGYEWDYKGVYYRNGKRVYPPSFERISKNPLSLQDAHKLGAYHVDNTARATYRVIPVEGRAYRLKRKIPMRDPFEYYQKDDKIIEFTRHRIDSPGELREITYKGIAARRKGRGKSRKKVRVNTNVFSKKNIMKQLRGYGI